MDSDASTPGSPTSGGGFSTDRLPPTTSRSSSRHRSSTQSLSSEAEVDPEIVVDDNDAGDEEDEEGEDLYTDNFMQQDYQRLEAQDQYESVDLDDELQDERSFDQIMADRRAADAVLDARGGASVNRKLPRILRDQDTDDDADFRPRRRQRVEPPATDQTEEEPYEEEEDEEGEYEMYNVQGTLREWVTRDEVRRFIAKKFRQFLDSYVDQKSGNDELEYIRLINEMVAGHFILSA